MDNVLPLPVSRLKLYIGTEAEAYEAAKRDYDQFVIVSIFAYRGDPLVRTTCEFEILFENGVLQWQTWSLDLSQNCIFEDYCRSKPEFSPLLYDTKGFAIYLRHLNGRPISEYISLGDTVYVDLRTYSATWYRSLNLPNCDRLTYVVPYTYQSFLDAKHKKIKAICHLFDEIHTLNSSWVFFWAGTSLSMTQL